MRSETFNEREPGGIVVGTPAEGEKSVRPKRGGDGHYVCRVAVRVDFDRGQRIANPPFNDGADQVDMVSLAIAYVLDAFSRLRQALPGFVTAAIHRMSQATQDVGQRESRVVRQRFLRGLEHPGKACR